jgi:hypothetical protein
MERNHSAPEKLSLKSPGAKDRTEPCLSPKSAIGFSTGGGCSSPVPPGVVGDKAEVGLSAGTRTALGRLSSRNDGS